MATALSCLPSSAQPGTPSMGVVRLGRPLGFALLGLPLLALVGGCTASAEPGCRVGAQQPLPPGTLGDIANVRLERVENGFLMAGWDETRGEVRAALIDEAGTVGPEARVEIAVPIAAGPWFAAVSKHGPADQLLVVYGAADPAQPDRIPLHLITAVAGEPAGRPDALVDPEGHPVSLPAPDAGVPATVKPAVTLGTSASGKMALFASAAAFSTASPLAFLIGADGATQSLPVPLPPPAGSTTCLALAPSRGAFSLSRVIPATPSVPRTRWLFAEINDDGVIAKSFDFDVLPREGSCPVVAPTARGYVAAWQNDVGTHLADIETQAAGAAIDAGLVKGAVRFGGADQQPPLASVASAGGDAHLLFAGSPPTVARYSRFGIRQGGDLELPPPHVPGAVAAWPRGNATYVTFLDTAGTSSVSQRVRQFLRVDCPADAPDAAAD